MPMIMLNRKRQSFCALAFADILFPDPDRNRRYHRPAGHSPRPRLQYQANRNGQFSVPKYT